MRAAAILVAGALALLPAACSGGGQGGSPLATPTGSGLARSSTATSGSSTGTSGAPTPATTATTATPATAVDVATGLDVPWSVAFLPDHTALVTLRDRAQVVHVVPGRSTTVVGNVPGADPLGEGGLLGIALTPTFARDRTLYLYVTTHTDNRVLRASYQGGKVTVAGPVLTGIPRADHHDGGRLAFGPDGYLYVGTGDAGDGSASQDLHSLGGKILRITGDGRPAPGNPFPGSPVWSYGHRNVQGFAWTADGSMYASEFGQNTWDELNLIEPGHNYGWPTVEGVAHRSGFVDPLREWPTDEASPSGITIGPDGAVYMAALRGECLWRIPVHGAQAGEPVRLLQGRYGRLRDVVLAPDGRLWVVTSNTFRGQPRPGDDRIVSVLASALS